jgi:hypothetical protein
MILLDPIIKIAIGPMAQADTTVAYRSTSLVGQGE